MCSSDLGGTICLASDVGGITLNAATFVTVGGNATNSGEIRFLEDTDNGSNYVAVKSLAALGNTWTLTLPNCNGTACQMLKTDGCGVTSWATAAGVSLGIVVALA